MAVIQYDMKKQWMIFTTSMVLILVLFANIVLLSAKMISEWVFWLVIIVAFIASKMILKINKAENTAKKSKKEY
ncbi:MAG: hypothetical protein KKF44_00085 [Nanoarchaeota archaeon]|nr:hypothetical protein [Nanoarchaeota archaeon]